MRVSLLIEKLNNILRTEGDLKVFIYENSMVYSVLGDPFVIPESPINDLDKIYDHLDDTITKGVVLSDTVDSDEISIKYFNKRY